MKRYRTTPVGSAVVVLLSVSGCREGESYSPVAPTSVTSPVTPQDIIVRHVEIDRAPPVPMLPPPANHAGPD